MKPICSATPDGTIKYARIRISERKIMNLRNKLIRFKVLS